MQRIIGFLLKYKYFLFFIFLQIIAFSLTIQSHSFHKSKFINSANAISGGIFNRVNSFQEYLDLKVHNDQLLEENVRLKNELSIFKKENPEWLQDTAQYDQKFSYISGKIINNVYHKKFNYLTLNKGSNDSIEPDLGVINSKGIVGITNTVYKKYATVISILNSSFNTNVKLKKKDNFHFGTLSWNGEDYNILQISDLPIQANIKVGDSIITGGQSNIFPENIPVGIVQNFETANNEYTFINVLLHNDMSDISPVNIIRNADKKKLFELEKTVY